MPVPRSIGPLNWVFGVPIPPWLAPGATLTVTEVVREPSNAITVYARIIVPSPEVPGTPEAEQPDTVYVRFVFQDYVLAPIAPPAA